MVDRLNQPQIDIRQNISVGHGLGKIKEFEVPVKDYLTGNVAKKQKPTVAKEVIEKIWKETRKQI